MKLGAYIVYHEEKDLLKGCIDLILPYVDELLIVNHGGEVYDYLEGYGDRIKIETISYTEPVDMGAVRTFAYSKMKSEWVLNVDADEYYPGESMIEIRRFVENLGDAISARVKYINLAWRAGYYQTELQHYPDRLYRRDVVDRVEGILPLDMHYVKKEYLSSPNKKKGMVGVLEYDNEDDQSFIHPRQPIINAMFYHLARTRGYNQEFTKNLKYQRNMHPEWSEEECIKMAKLNHWTAGLYEIAKIETPGNIPLQNIPNPKISVIITNYNYNHYLPESIGSVLSQTYPAYEILLIDDCSTEIPIVPDQVKLLRQTENKGVVSCRNWGISESTGDYYICLDADDFLQPNFIEECLKEMKGDVQIVYSNYKVFGDAEFNCDYGEFSSEKLKEFQTIPSCCALIDRHVFELTGGFDPTAHWEDWEFWLRCDKLGFNFKRVDKFLFNYRRHKGSRIDLLDEKKEEETKKLKEKYL